MAHVWQTAGTAYVHSCNRLARSCTVQFTPLSIDAACLALESTATLLVDNKIVVEK